MSMHPRQAVSITVAMLLSVLAGIVVGYFAAWALLGSQAEAVRALVVIIPVSLAVAVVTQLIARRRNRPLE